MLGGTPDLISRLLRVGLWIEDAGKYWIRNFEAKNQTPEQIEKRKQAAKERKERFKSKKNTPGNANGTRSERVPSGVGVGVGVNDLSSEEGSGEEPSEEAPRASGAMGFAASSWVEGVRSVTKGRPTLAWWERRDIEDLARDRPQDVGAAEWGRAEGEAFAKRQKACKPPPQVTAKNYLAWVGDGRPPPFDRSLRVAGPIVDEAAERKRIDREQRDRAYLHRKMVDEAAPMPVELLKVLGVTGAAG